MKKIYIIIAAVVIGLVAWLIIKHDSFCPCPNELREIEERPYIDDVYTCLHKSRDYCKVLRNAGYDAYIVVGTVTWDERDHAWVEIRHEGKIYWVDVTTESSCFESHTFTDREVIDSPYASPDY